MLGKKLINAGPVSSGANTFASENFNTVLYTGNGGTQRIGGYINRGGVFGGTSSYISTSLNAHNIETISYSAWVYWDSNIAGALIGGLGNDGTSGSKSNRQTVSLNYSNNRFDYISRQGDYCRHTTSLSEGWHHFVVTDNNGTVSSTAVNMYIDGSEVSFSQPATGNYSTNTQLQIGRTTNNAGSIANYFNGKVDQIRIFNKELSSSEVTTLYGETHSSTTISTTDIFNDNSGVALYQLDGNANDTGGASGKFGSGGIFTGGNASTGSKISISNDVYGSSTSVFSASIWVNSNTNSGEIPLIGNGATIGGTTGYAVYLNNGELTLTFRTNPNQNFYYTNTSLYQQGWKHIVLTVNDGAYVLYLDGTSVLNGTTANWSSNPTPTYDTFIGNRWNRNESGVFDGIVDEIRIYSDVLTSTEVGYLYNNTTASIPTDNLQA